MIGLMYLMAAAVYLVIMIKAVGFAWKKGLASGSRKRAWIYGILAFLLVYLPVFWDHIPTVVAHRYYCAKDGGVHVYKDPQEWLAEHKGEIESLRVKAGGEHVGAILPDGWERSHLINKRVAFDALYQSFHVFFGVDLERDSRRLVDVVENKVLVTYTNYGSYRSFNSGGLKFWLNFTGCSDGLRPQWAQIKANYLIYSQNGEEK